MTALPIRTGPTRKQLIDDAYRACGVSEAVFGRTPEEYADAMAELELLMGEWPWTLTGYVLAESDSTPEEPTGLLPAYREAVALALAERIAWGIGKQLSPSVSRRARESFSRLCGRVSVVPTAEYAPPTIRGAGARRWGRFFPSA